MKKFFRGFAFAFQGITYFFKTQLNARVELTIAILVIFSGFLFGISNTEWLVVLLCIGSVLSMEIINTAIEALCDKISPEHNEKIGIVKDLAAGAVLFISFITFIIGLIIFTPHIINLFTAN